MSYLYYCTQLYFFHRGAIHFSAIFGIFRIKIRYVSCSSPLAAISILIYIHIYTEYIGNYSTTEMEMIPYAKIDRKCKINFLVRRICTYIVFSRKLEN